MEMMRNDVDEMRRPRDEMSLRHVHVQDAYEMRQDEMSQMRRDGESEGTEMRWDIDGMRCRWYEDDMMLK